MSVGLILQRVVMKLWIIPFLGAVIAKTDGFGLAEMVSNYAKVTTNKGNQTNANITLSTTTTSTSTTAPVFVDRSNSSSTNTSNDDYEELEEYDDFDDLQESTERSQTTNNDSKTMLTYLNGLVSLLAMMYKFSGTPSSARPPKLHFEASRPRLSSRDEFADNINNLAEDRFHPTTSTKKFKVAQDGYSTMKENGFSSYDSYAAAVPADSYSSNGGKTSYDSDSSQYSIKNPENSATPDKGPEQASYDNSHTSYNPKNPMNDYINQNDVEIHQSYSYELTEPPIKKRPNKVVDNSMIPPDHGYMKAQSKEVFYPMKKKQKPKPEIHPWNSKPYIEDDDDHHELPEVENSPLYYPWSSSPPKNKKPAPEMEEVGPEDHYEHAPVYYTWMNQKPKKSKPVPPIENEPDEHESPPELWSKKKPVLDQGDDIPHDYYPYLHDHEVYHDHPPEEEEEHDMMDEDRESKRPYSYYHLGRKLWYVPLLFSLYFIIYIGSLILKSIARHKIQLPEKLYDLSDHEHHHHDEHRRKSRRLNDITQEVHDSLDNAANKFM